MKKWIISLLVIFILCGIRFSNPWFLDVVRLKALDQHQRNQTTQVLSDIVTVEINNKTLKKIGQWPLPRDQLVDQIARLYDAGAGVVVLPILFADEDRFGKDKVFANFLRSTPTIIGQIPNQDSTGHPVARGVAAVGKPWQPWIYRYPGAAGPIPELSKAANGVGMMVISPEKDGVVRRMPLGVAINGKIYPSMSMEILRVAAGDISFQMKTGDGGIEAFRIPKFKIIKTDANGNIWLDFKFRTHVYPLHEKLPDLSGKIVILSLTAAGLDNPVSTPVGVIQGHDLTAASLATMMTGRNISRPFWADLGELITSFVLALILCVVVLTLKWYYGAALLPLVLGGTYYASHYLFVNHSYLIDWSYPILTIFVAWAIASFLRFMEEYRLKQQIKKQFGTYLSPDMVEKLQKDPDLLKLGGETRELSIMFTDVRGFTTISEHYGEDVQGLTKIMNRYMTAMSESILENNGTIDKYIGDAQMAFWNAPLDDPDHAKKSIETALKMMKRLETFNDEISNEQIPPFGMGIGINTGSVVVGNMGSDLRFDYTCLGDSVNLAARLEGQSKNYGVDIILGEETVNQIPGFQFMELDRLVVKGKSKPVTIYTILDKEYDNSTVEYHNKFLEIYRLQDWPNARQFAKELAGEFDEKMYGYYIMMIKRIESYKKSSLPEDWGGEFVSTTK